MTVIIITVILLGLIYVIFFTRWLTTGIDILFRLAYNHHKKLRRELRPSRIFLVRHGESQANLDTSKYFISILFIYLSFHSTIRTYA